MESCPPGFAGAAAFDLVWATLVGVLGTAAAATMIRRAARRGAARYPELEGVIVRRAGLDYEYVLPERWKEAEAAPPALVHLVQEELFPILRELTGQIVIQRLERLPELTAAGVVPAETRRPAP